MELSALAKFPQGPNRPPLRFKITAGPSRLVPVKDRKGAVVPIPTRHLGQVIPSMSIGELADIVVQHLENVVGEAEKLPQE